MTILDGTTAAFDFTTGTAASDSWKCVATYAEFNVRRDFIEQTTFCSTGGWRERLPILKQVIGRITGFLSKGEAISDPLHLFSGTAGVPFVFTADTGCTLSGNLHAANYRGGMRAQANSEMDLDYESTGSVSSSWTVA